MKFGPRIPSLRKRIAARTSPARFIRHSLGLKAPRGWGWLTNPKKAAYNRIYNRTTFGCLLPALAGVLLVALLAGVVFAGDETHLYDAQGHYLGYSKPDWAIPGQQIIRGANGQYLGHATTTPSGGVVVRDQHGNLMGRGGAWKRSDKRRFGQ